MICGEISVRINRGTATNVYESRKQTLILKHSRDGQNVSSCFLDVGQICSYVLSGVGFVVDSPVHCFTVNPVEFMQLTRICWFLARTLSRMLFWSVKLHM